MDTDARITDYLEAHKHKLDLIERMWRDPFVQCYNDNIKPPRDNELLFGSVFLAGPTSRSQLLELNWRSEAVALLRDSGYHGIIYVPEPRGIEHEFDFTERDYIFEWESSRLLYAIAQVFWVPRDSIELFGLNTNFEWGVTTGQLLSHTRDLKSVFVGWPSEAVRMGLPHHYAVMRAGCSHYSSLSELCTAVKEYLSTKKQA